ncbi:MAG: hypothetical protein AAGA32_15575 [Pseudomonadota bacterium]
MRVLLSVCLGVALAGSAAAEESGGKLSLELNAVQSSQSGCTLTFLIENGLAAPIEALVFETVLFDAEGTVDRLTLFDFGAVPVARPRVRQFVVRDLACDALGRVLINGAETCTAPPLAPATCETDLGVSSRTGIEIIG